MDAMLPRMMEEAGVTAELKAHDPMRRVGLMNALKAQVEKALSGKIINQEDFRKSGLKSSCDLNPPFRFHGNLGLSFKGLTPAVCAGGNGE